MSRYASLARMKSGLRVYLDRPDAEIPADTTADRLLRTSARLFRERSYALTTTRAISEELGIEKASLYHYVNGKEELLYVICKRGLQKLTDALTAASESEPDETRLEAMMREHLISSIEDADFHMTMLSELRALTGERLTEVLAARDEYENLFQQVIVADQAAGRLRADVSPSHLRLAMMNILNWTIFWWRPEGDLDPQAVSALLADLFLRGAAISPKP